MIQLTNAGRWTSHRVREAGVHISRLVQNSRLPRVLFSVDDGDGGMSSGLRGYSLARELRNLGWRTSILPKQLELSQRERLVRVERPDIVILQNCRHPLNRPRYYKGSICVFDIDDADFVDPSRRETVTECVKNSALVIAGSRFVADFARQHNPNVEVLWTGSRPRRRSSARKVDPPVIAWAVSSVRGYPEEFAFVKSALGRVTSKNWQFWLFGVNDARDAQSIIDMLRNQGISCQVFPFMKYKSFLQMLELVSIGLAPLVPDASQFSAGKSFGKVLGYLNCRATIVASDAAEHPMFFRTGTNGFLASNEDQFAEIIDLLLLDSDLREQIAERAHLDYVDKLSVKSVARSLDMSLRPLLPN